MPKLTVFAACERVIVDRVGLPSLINIFQRMNVKLVDPVPEDAIIPNQWAVFVLWQHSDSELNVEFTQHLEIVAPDGKIFLTGKTTFKITEVDDRQSKNHIIVNGLPVWAEGFISLNVWLEGAEDTKHSYLFFVKHLPHDNETSSSEPKGFDDGIGDRS